MSVHNGHTDHSPSREPTTLRSIAAMAAAGDPFACLACYDYTTAKLLERAGVHLLLAGDSAANVILGHDSTIHAPLDFLITITAAIKRGAPSTVLMADMPFLSYHKSIEQAVTNAGRFMTEAHADIVKLEADASFAETVKAITRAGIPVCAHVGTRPQMWALTSGPKADGRTEDAAQRIVEDAVALERAGAMMLLIEAVPPEVARRVIDATSVPLIGIGAGTDCHGQILVVHDLLGLTDHPPRFAQPAENLAPRITDAARTWVRRVADRDIGGQNYQMKTDQIVTSDPASRTFPLPATK